MKQALLSIILLVSASSSFCCSVFNGPFCETAEQLEVVVLGKVLDTIPHGIRFQVLSVIKGTENRDTVIIWDGTDIDCNGPFPMNASMMGMPGDTLLAALTPVDSVENVWDVMGDYRRSNWFGFTPELRFVSDTLLGFISGSSIAPPTYQLYKMAYSDFIAYWTTHTNSCVSLVGIEEPLTGPAVYPNPFTGVLQIDGLTTEADLSIYDPDGRTLWKGQARHYINLRFLPAGIYYLEMQYNKQRSIRPIIKF